MERFWTSLDTEQFSTWIEICTFTADAACKTLKDFYSQNMMDKRICMYTTQMRVEVIALERNIWWVVGKMESFGSMAFFIPKNSDSLKQLCVLRIECCSIPLFWFVLGNGIDAICDVFTEYVNYSPKKWAKGNTTIFVMYDIYKFSMYWFSRCTVIPSADLLHIMSISTRERRIVSPRRAMHRTLHRCQKTSNMAPVLTLSCKNHGGAIGHIVRIAALFLKQWKKYSSALNAWFVIMSACFRPAIIFPIISVAKATIS